MIDEENQQDNTTRQTDKPMEDSLKNQGGESAAAEVDLTSQVDLESLPTLDDLAADLDDTSVVTEQGEVGESVAVEADGSASSPAEMDLAILESLKRENEALKAQLEDISQQTESFKTQSMRIAADFDNFRKRTSKEKEDLEVQVKRNTISELLPVIDNFERARSQIKPQTDGEMTIHKSYQGVYKQLVDCLKRIGVAPMRPEGQEFDPNLHEAVMREPTNEYPEGVVIEQLMRGYFIGDRVLRHAMVKVAAAAEPVVTSEEGIPET
ncbi:nucleotide exchange factor GrpE [Microcoleus sp. FACHB-SPT15]|nr:nucleotide exchange factor GrpE [Microcoleus sp. FACHB-SPT15]MBD1804608.1 nucleotide exchange factor GrpE [Microcoleus sp. FACHB-SPT15]